MNSTTPPDPVQAPVSGQPQSAQRTPALISLPALERALSAQRLQAYRLPTDQDETDGLARYLWNLGLVGALQPVLHVLEIAFRNEVSRAASRLTASRGYAVDRIPSWLDATPTMLLPHEFEKVANAKKKLGTDPRSQTEGHLIAKLDFGFWVALCRLSYDSSRGETGPRLWPGTLEIAFRGRPADVTTRSQIWHLYDPIREFRNRVAHHEPIWDRDFVTQHDEILRGIRWINPKLASATAHMSTAVATYHRGPAAFREHAEEILGTGVGHAQRLGQRIAALPAEQMTAVASLVSALATAPSEPAAEVMRRVAAALHAPTDSAA